MLLEADSPPQQDTLLSPFVDSQHDIVIDDTADPKTLAAHSVTSFSTQSAGTIARKMGRKNLILPWPVRQPYQPANIRCCLFASYNPDGSYSALPLYYTVFLFECQQPKEKFHASHKFRVLLLCIWLKSLLAPAAQEDSACAEVHTHSPAGLLYMYMKAAARQRFLRAPNKT